MKELKGRPTEFSAEKMLEMYVAGFPLKQIAWELGCHLSLPGKYAKKLGLQRRERKAK